MIDKIQIITDVLLIVLCAILGCTGNKGYLIATILAIIVFVLHLKEIAC